ncbi:MAG: hypothetical protein HZB40_18080 [Rhodocyclales bacterium]|nr:hypothetical protein [Rhodocyclales bacterium]
MAKFLLFLAVVAAIYLLVRASNRRGNPPGKAGPDPGTEEMARCALCQVHFPRSESRRQDGKDFCCDEHRRLGAGD